MESGGTSEISSSTFKPCQNSALSLSFNQSYELFAVGHHKGFSVYSVSNGVVQEKLNRGRVAMQFFH